MEVFTSGRSSWAPDMDDEFLRHTTQDLIHYQLVKALGFRSYLSVPLRNGDEVQGTLTLVSSQRPFGAADVSFAERLALQVAGVVNNARRFDASQETSQILQHALLPRGLPEVEGLEIETRYLPATRGLEVGGDFYDVVVLPSHRLGFMIGDVAGHDRDAAATMGQLRSAARALAGQVREPAALIEALQWSWDLLGFDRIATALVGRLDQTTGDLVLASAGHHPPLVLTPEGSAGSGGSARFLPVAPSTPLGAPAAPATEWVGTLAPGQVLLLYTDGVLDSRSADPDTSGMERLAGVAGGGEISPVDVCDRVIGALPQHRIDDVALLAFRLVP
jgi:serine/threonine-protein kinase RsbW